MRWAVLMTNVLLNNIKRIFSETKTRAAGSINIIKAKVMPKVYQDKTMVHRWNWFKMSQIVYYWTLLKSSLKNQ